MHKLLHFLEKNMQWGNDVGGPWFYLFEFDWMMKSGFVMLLVNIFLTYIEALLS